MAAQHGRRKAIQGVVDQLHRHFLPGSQHCTAIGLLSGGPGSVILDTTNGGTTWAPQTPPAAATALNGISCSSDTTCLATGSHVIGTTDGGSQWNDLGAPTGSTALAPSVASVLRPAPPSGRQHRRHHRWTVPAGQASLAPSGVGALLGVSCASPVNCEAVGTGTNSGGTIATLSAPPTVTTTASLSEPSACPIGFARRQRWVGTLFVGSNRREPAARIHLAANGTLSGTPTISGSYQVTFTVTDSNFLSTRRPGHLHQSDRRTGVLGGRQRRRDLQLRRRPVLRLDGKPPPQRTDRRHGRHAGRCWLLATGVRRRHLLLRRRRLLWVHRRHAPQCPHRRHVANGGWRRILACCLRRRHFRLR